ncbi:hypothetical protein FNF31_00289 [Cafeteria roenbergensis]|uniref:CN hydrolase domain-containing protein n=1 Tax=Cafeteria roenbergensis TaxID=33653 RepID=A0A5A8DUX3_CAFRO|nr:hypothetical protein FNF28_03408 [Cafeteria roenbergensis]KAA0168407.1 hypothetical protein FNF31_00289 [Cafeteria roenbergensis]
MSADAAPPAERTQLRVGIAQVAVPLLDRSACVAKVASAIAEAGRQGVELLAFGEACIPGYPVWLERTGGAVFDSPTQKAIHAVYLREAVCIEDGHLDPIVKAAAAHGVHVVLGIIERPRHAQFRPAGATAALAATDPGAAARRTARGASGHSVYCSMVHVSPSGGGRVLSVHRKLVPTYEERLAWAHGDTEGLVTWPVGPFTVGGTLCFETWMPLARAALHAQGEDLHVSLWPGSDRNTRDCTRFVALEGRSFVLSASCVLSMRDIPEEIRPSAAAPSPPASSPAATPAAAKASPPAAAAGGLPVLRAAPSPATVDRVVPLRELCMRGHRSGGAPTGAGAAAGAGARAAADGSGSAASSAPGGLDTVLHNGGSCIAAPDGRWIVSPDDTSDGAERLIVASVDLAEVRGARQNFDPAGHYARPDLLRLNVQRSRAAAAEYKPQ